MRSFSYVLSALAVIALAYWAYYENYRTQAAISHSERLEAEYAMARQRLRVLNAEWAYLNRPARLRELADINFDRLGLIPLEAQQFGRIDEVEYPLAEELLIDFANSVEVSNQPDEEPFP